MSEVNRQEDTPKWDHISETVTMLYLAVCQIEASVCDSNKSVAHLTESFTRLAQHNLHLNERIQSLPDSADTTSIKSEAAESSQQMQSTINESIEAFQFYDRISQRLDHVAHGLEGVCDIFNDKEKRDDPASWKNIQEEVRSSYSMEAERIMFEHILRGASVKEALKIYHHHFDASETDSISGEDEVELF